MAVAVYKHGLVLGLSLVDVARKHWRWRWKSIARDQSVIVCQMRKIPALRGHAKQIEQLC